MKSRVPLLAAVGAALFVGLTGCPQVVTPTEKDQFEATRKALAAYFDSNPAATIAAADVFDVLNDGDTSNDPYVLSVRSAADYAKGHVPGAENVPWRNVAKVDALADVPTDRQVVVYCYTGHTGAVATTCLNAMGYDAVNMKYGMTAWTRDATVRVAAAFDDSVDSHDYPLETTINTAEATNALPTMDVTTSTDDAEIVRAAIDTYLSANSAPTINAADLFDLLNDGDASNDPFIVSVRSETHYALGHIPGAINIPWKTIAAVDNLKKLPTDQKIVVYCYTGHTGGLATAALNILGYDAVNLKFGIMSWTKDAAVRATSPFVDANDAHDYPTEP